MGIKIITDSSADLSGSVRERTVFVPLTVRFGNEEYLDREELDAVGFYEKLIESDTLPTTSQANMSDFEAVLDRETADGSDIVVITLSSKLSGTYMSAKLAAEKYGGSVYVVDSLSVSIGVGILTELAWQLADSGMCAADIAHRIESERELIKIIAMFDTLEYLKRGGRVSGAAAAFGGLLAIKPAVTINDGEVTILGKARGSRQASNFLNSSISSCGGIDFSKPLLLGYTGLDDSVLQKYIEDSAHIWQGNVDSLNISTVGSIVGTHAGPGAIAVAFFANKN